MATVESKNWTADIFGDLEIQAGRNFRSQKEDLSGKKRTYEEQTKLVYSIHYKYLMPVNQISTELKPWLKEVLQKDVLWNNNFNYRKC